jgi:hypothetical protein
MARVRLSRHEVEEGALPFVCLRCGAPATLTRYKTFSWHPNWIDWFLVIGLLCFTPLLIAGVVLSFAMAERMRVPVPLCEAHKNHWRWRSWFIYGGLALFAVLGIGALVFWGSTIKSQHEALKAAAGWLCAATGVLALAWLIAAAIVQNKAIRAIEITEQSITLIKASPDFAEALAQERRDLREAEDAEEYQESPHRRERLTRATT